MPESGYYEKRPRKEHRKFLVDYLEKRNNISSVQVLDDFRLDVVRPGQTDVRIFLTNLYTTGVADVLEILGSHPETTCIVTTMDYNQYSRDAKILARDNGVGLFTSKEFLGAVYYQGEKFLDYLPPDQRE